MTDHLAKFYYNALECPQGISDFVRSSLADVIRHLMDRMSPQTADCANCGSTKIQLFKINSWNSWICAMIRPSHKKSTKSLCLVARQRWVARSSAEHCRPTRLADVFFEKLSTESKFPSETQSLAVCNILTQNSAWHSGPQKDLDHELLDTAAKLEPRPIQADGHTVAKLSVG
eukprot:s2398_g9.t1